jgi:hypothetical protein
MPSKENNDAFHESAGTKPAANKPKYGDDESGEVKVFDERGRRTTAPVGTGVSIEGRHLSEEDLTALKATNPDLHAAIAKMRGGLQRNTTVDSGGGRRADATPTGEERPAKDWSARDAWNC